MIVVVFVISVLNLVLGFLLAVHLGFGPPQICRSWADMLGIPSGGPPTDMEPVVEDLADARPAPDPPATDDTPPLEPATAPAEDQPPPAPDRDEFAILCRSVAKIDARLNDLTKLLGDHDRWPPGKTAWSFVTELQEICEPYLRHLDEAMNHLCGDLGTPVAAGDTQLNDDVEQLILEQVAQVETTLSNLQYMDFDSGLTAALERLVAEAANTRSSATRLNQALQSLSVEAEHQET